MLVSKSPRRSDLLKKAGYQFEPLSLETSEIIDENLNCFEQSAYLADLKMNHFKEAFGLKYKNFSFALTCDTMVEFEGETLGKPTDQSQALGWLLSYSKKMQLVHTGCCLLELDGSGKQKSWVTTTKVYFGEIDEKAALHYFGKHPDYISKAGGYGLQDEHFTFVEKIEGSYTNVVGLPMERFAEEVQNWD